MLKALLARAKFGNRTIGFPDEAPILPERFQGRPEIGSEPCANGCSDCVAACPTSAIAVASHHPVIDLGRCLFCGVCEVACTSGSIRYSSDYRMAASNKSDLVMRHGTEKAMVHRLHDDMMRLFGRSLRLRQVSAGGCNGCEVEVNVLGTIVFDLGRFGIQFVASPRHADGLLITGPVTENMRLALQKTYEATPDPKIVIAVGACAISGGPYADHRHVHNGADSQLPVDLFIPGCPPHPITILDGLLALLGRMPKERVASSG